MAIPERMRKWRDSHNLSRAQVAAEAGVSERTVWRWEDDAVHGPSLTQVEALERRWPGLLAVIQGEAGAA